MSEPHLPRRPISPWPIGAGILGTFVALAIFLNDGTLAVEVMTAAALLAGLLLMRKKEDRGQENLGGKSASQQPTQQKKPCQPLAPASFADPDDLPAVLTVDEVASYLRSDVLVVIAELEAGQMPGNKLGPDWRIRRQALDVWLDGAHRVSTAGPASR
jgi:excisionase family DNA binding protein